MAPCPAPALRPMPVGWEGCAHSKQDSGQQGTFLLLLSVPHPGTKSPWQWTPGRRLRTARTPGQRLSQPGFLGRARGHRVTVDHQPSSTLMVAQQPCGSCLLAAFSRGLTSSSIQHPADQRQPELPRPHTTKAPTWAETPGPSPQSAATLWGQDALPSSRGFCQASPDLLVDPQNSMSLPPAQPQVT